MDLLIKKCSKCKATVRVLEDCNCEDCGIKCCGGEMDDVIANSVDASFEKHIPSYNIDGDKLKVKVNHVMEDDHYIKWVCFKSKDKEEFVYFKPGMEVSTTFKNEKGVLYSYCNKHGLWKQEIK